MRRLIFSFLLACSVLTAFSAVSPAETSAAELRSISTETSVDFPGALRFGLTAEASEDIDRVELLYTLAENETLHLRTVANEIPAGPVDLEDEIDMLTAVIPPGIDLEVRWRITFASGAVTETEPEAITWEDTRFDWESVESDQVTVYYYTGNEAFATIVLESAQSTIDRLQSEFAVERSRPIRLWVYNTRSDYAGTQAPNSQEWSVGVAFPAYQVILAVLPEGNQREVGRVVPHEISHQVLFQATRNPFNAPPTWLDEGLAVSAQANGNEDFQAMVERAAEDGRLFSIRALTSEFPYDPADASLAYAESFSIVQFMIVRWGPEGVAKVIDAYRQGLSHDDVLLAALGVDMDELDRLWKESLNYQGDSGVAGFADGGDEGSPWEQLLLSSSEVALIGAAMAALVVMWRRRNRQRSLEPDFELVSSNA